MVNKNNMDAFLSHNYVPFRKTQCFMRILWIWGIGLSVGLLGTENEVWITSVILANILISSRFFFLLTRESSTRNARFICDGVFYAYISVMLCVASYRVVALCAGDNLLLLISFLILLLINNVIHILIVYSHIKKNSYGNTFHNQKKILLPFAGGLLGMFAARLLLHNLTQDIAIMMIVICLLLLSFLFGIGSINLLKAILYKQQTTN